MRLLRCFITLAITACALAPFSTRALAKDLPLPGEVFTVNGRPAFIVPPTVPTPDGKPTPWVWYAPTLARLPAREEAWMFERFPRAGVAVAGIDVGES